MSDWSLNDFTLCLQNHVSGFSAMLKQNDLIGLRQVYRLCQLAQEAIQEFDIRLKSEIKKRER